LSDDGAVRISVSRRVGQKTLEESVKPGRKMRVGATARSTTSLCEFEEIKDGGERHRCPGQKIVDLYAGGSMPLPPYINRASDEKHGPLSDRFSDTPGAIARHGRSSFHGGNFWVKSHTFVTLHVGREHFCLCDRKNHRSSHACGALLNFRKKPQPKS